MDWLTMLRRSGGINALARQIGANPGAVAAATDALLPALLGGMRQRAARLDEGEPGIRRLIDLFGEHGGAQLAADVMGPGPLDTTGGDAVVAEVLGPQVARRAVVAEAQRISDAPAELLERLLSPLAMLVGGYLSARVVGSGAAGSGGIEDLATLLVNEDEIGEDRI